MNKLVKVIATLCASSILLTNTAMSVFAAEQDTGSENFIPIASTGTIEDIAHTTDPYIVNRETGQVCFYDLDDFDVTTMEARSGESGSITFSGTIAIPADPKPRYSMSDETDDDTYGVHVKLTLNYKSKTLRDVKWYVATGAEVDYDIGDSQLRLEDGVFVIGSTGTNVQSQVKEFPLTSSFRTTKSVNFSEYISEVDPYGMVGAYATRDVTRIVSGSSWELTIRVTKLDV